MNQLKSHGRRRRSQGLSPVAGMLWIVLVVSLVWVAKISAAWTVPDDVSPDGANADMHQLAIDSDGDALIVWRRPDGSNERVEARARDADGTLGPTEAMSGLGYNARNPQVAIDDSGNALVVWSRLDGSNFRFEARARSASGALGPIEILLDAEQSAASARVAMDPDGNAVVVWSNWVGANRRVQARARSASGALGAIRTLSAKGQDAITPQVAMDPSGNAVVVWLRFDGAHYRVQARARSASGQLSATKTLSAANQTAGTPQLAVDLGGNTVVVWHRFDGVSNRVQARVRKLSGKITPTRSLSAAGHNALSAQVGVDAAGNALVVWYAFDGADVVVQARERTAAGALSTIQTLSDPGQDPGPAQVVVDADGNGVVAWHRFEGGNLRAQARTRMPDGTLSPVENLSPVGVNVSYPELAGNLAGNVVAVWVRSGPFTRIQAEAGP